MAEIIPTADINMPIINRLSNFFVKFYIDSNNLNNNMKFSYLRVY